jgi:hypothetical protein
MGPHTHLDLSFYLLKGGGALFRYHSGSLFRCHSHRTAYIKSAKQLSILKDTSANLVEYQKAELLKILLIFLHLRFNPSSAYIKVTQDSGQGEITQNL